MGPSQMIAGLEIDFQAQATPLASLQYESPHSQPKSLQSYLKRPLPKGWRYLFGELSLVCINNRDKIQVSAEHQHHLIFHFPQSLELLESYLWNLQLVYSEKMTLTLILEGHPFEKEVEIL